MNTDNVEVVAIGQQKRHRKRRSHGYITLIVLFFFVVFAVAMSTLASLTSNQLQSSKRGLIRSKALSLAEAGIDDASQRLNTKLGGDLLYTGTGARATTLYEAANAPFGTFTTTITSIDAWKRKVISTGTSIDRGTLTLTAILNIEKIKLGADRAAIKSNGEVMITGTADINTVPAGRHNANVMSNGSLFMKGNSTVDGALMSYTGVSSGEGYVPNVQLDSKVTFLTPAMLESQKIEMTAKAKEGGTVSMDITKSTTFSGSMYIDGDIRLTGANVVTLAGTGNDVVFVNGDVSLSGGTLVNGVTLIVNGVFSQTGQSVYKAINGRPTPTLFVYNTNNETVGVKLTGGSMGDFQGIIYGAQGDITVAGGATITGAIYAGGTDAMIKAAGNFTLNYPDDMQSALNEPGSTFVTQVLEL